MGAIVPEYEVQASKVVVDPATGSAMISLQTDQGAVALYMSADVLLLLKDRIEKPLIEEWRED
jgi:hypothetical protein